MQISHVDVTPVQMKLQEPFRTAAHPEPVTQIETVFIRAELVRDYGDAWGCAVLNPIGEETLHDVMRASQACADKLRDLNPLNTQRALADLSELTDGYPAVQCAFDMLLYDLLGLWSGLPLFR